jgi:hypothetical protein
MRKIRYEANLLLSVAEKDDSTLMGALSQSEELELFDTLLV